MKILITEFINKNSLDDLNNNFEIKFDEKLWEKEEELLETIKDYDGLIVDVRFNGGGHVSQLLLSKLGFKILEISTPGQLDIDILMNNENLIRDRFWKTFIKYSTKASRAQMQSLISKSGLSSHMMVCCQKI